MRIIKIIKKSLKIRYIVLAFILFVILAAGLIFFTPQAKAVWSYSQTNNVTANCVKNFQFWFNTGIKDGTQGMFVSSNPENALVYVDSWLRGSLSDAQGAGAGTDDPLIHGVLGHIVARNYACATDSWTGTICGCTPETTSGCYTTPYWGTCSDPPWYVPYPCLICDSPWSYTYTGNFSVDIIFGGGRNEPSEANLAPAWGPKGFPYFANIGVSTNEPPNTTIPTQPILSWTITAGSQERWYLQIDNNSDFSSPEWNSGDQPGAGTSVQPTLPANQTFYWRVSACGTIGGQSCAWTPWANGNAPFSTAVPANNASCLGITAPASVTVNQTFNASIDMNNNGTKVWNSDATPHRLGSQNPQDNMTWGLSRVGLPWEPVNLGQSVTFNFNATAPSSPGTYPFDWKMVEDGIEWFGATCQKNITVVSPTYVINPATATRQVGQTQQFNGLYDPDGPGGAQAQQDVTASASWTSSNTSIATINTSGLATCVAAGTVTITSIYNTITATASLTCSAVATYTLTVTKAGSGTGTVTSAPAGINCGATCSASYTSGTSVTLTAVASGGSTFAGWSGEGCSGTGTCTVSMTQARNVTATFTLSTCSSSPTQNLVAGDNAIDFQTPHNYPNNLDCYSNVYTCPSGYNAKAYVSYITESGYDYFYIYNQVNNTFTRWSGNSGGFVWREHPNTNQIKFRFTSDSNLTLWGVDVDTINCYPLPTYVISPSSASQQVGQAQQFTGYYDPDGPSGAQAQQDVTASASWTSSNTSIATINTSGLATCVAAGGPVTIRSIYSSINATASFTCTAVPTYTLTVTRPGTGSGTVTSAPAGINCGVTCSANYNSGTSVTLTAVASGGSTFTGWSGEGCSGTGTCTVSMTQARNVTATFNSLPTPNTLTYTAPDYCILLPGGRFGWIFNNQSAYQVQVDNTSNFSSPEVDSCQVNSSSNLYAVGFCGACCVLPTCNCALTYNQTYYWRVRVWDSFGTASNWFYPPSPPGNPTAPPGTSFTTPIHEYPTINSISWIPQTPSAGEIIAFAANTVCFVLGGGTTPCPQVGYAWSFPGGSPSTVTNDTTPQVTFALSGSVQAGLRITDAQGYTCPASGYFWTGLMIRLPLPGWREVTPQ